MTPKRTTSNVAGSGDGATPKITAAERIRKQTRDATRRALLEAGLAETIARGGFEEPSIDAICERAGYSRGAFYVHFRDRDHFDAEMLEWVLNDILRALLVDTLGDRGDIRDIVERFTSSMTRRDWPDLHGDIRAGYLAILRSIVSGGAEVKARHATLMTGVIDVLGHGIATGQAEGWIREGIDPRRLGAFLMLAAIGSIVWDDIGIDLDLPAVGAGFVDLLTLPSSEG